MSKTKSLNKKFGELRRELKPGTLNPELFLPHFDQPTGAILFALIAPITEFELEAIGFSRGDGFYDSLVLAVAPTRTAIET